MFALDALGVVLFQLPVVKLVEGRSRMRGLALMGAAVGRVVPRRLGGRFVDAGDRRVRDPRRRDARLRGRGVPARGDPGAAQRRPRAAAARRPLPRSLEHLVADRLDRRSRGRRLHAPAPAAPALADRGGSQPRLRGGGTQARAAAARAGSPDAAAGKRRRLPVARRAASIPGPCPRPPTPSVPVPSLPRIRSRRRRVRVGRSSDARPAPR